MLQISLSRISLRLAWLRLEKSLIQALDQLDLSFWFKESALFGLKKSWFSLESGLIQALDYPDSSCRTDSDLRTTLYKPEISLFTNSRFRLETGIIQALDQPDSSYRSDLGSEKPESGFRAAYLMLGKAFRLAWCKRRPNSGLKSAWFTLEIRLVQSWE